LLIREIDF